MNLQPGQLATYSLRQTPRGEDICRILAAAIHSADPGEAIRKTVALDGDLLQIAGHPFHLDELKRIYVIGAGKAAVPMADALAGILGKRISGGLVITKLGHLGQMAALRHNRVSIIEAAHPLPDQTNLEASALLAPLLHHLTSHDLVLCLISGGGSALLMQPSAGISIEDIRLLTQQLLASGAEIGEINSLRKHLDELKGGRLAKRIHPARLVTLILSDVVGDRLDQIASGPTVADPTTYQLAWSILEKYKLIELAPQHILALIQRGISGEMPESVKPGDPALEGVVNVIVGSNTQVVQAAQQAAAQAGFTTHILDRGLHGEAAQAGRDLAERVKATLASGEAGSLPACFIAGGETTVTIHGNGKGGRNQELALGAVEALAGEQPIVLASLATDGQDGPTEAAGAVATHLTYARGLSMGLNPTEYLANNDSYPYFERLGDLLETGPTLTNVNDLVLIFAL